MKQPFFSSAGEYKILSSQFKAMLIPISSREDFQSLYDCFKKQYPKADHYPYAYIIDDYSKCSDDGEPSGSAGRPLLELLQQKQINHALIIIARYFGGRKLGVQRLRKSFLEVATMAIDLGTYGEEKRVGIYEISLPIDQLPYLRSNLINVSGQIIEEEYDENEATIKAYCPLDINIDNLLPDKYKGLAILIGEEIKLL